jgi:hypothetical protein
MTTPRRSHTSVLVNTLNLVLIGGLDVNTLNTADIFNISSSAFSSNSTNTMITARHYHTTTRLGRGAECAVISKNFPQRRFFPPALFPKTSLEIKKFPPTALAQTGIFCTSASRKYFLCFFDCWWNEHLDSSRIC